MNGFYIQVTNNLLDSKHIENMGSAVWLFMWFLDKMTSIDENGVGKVLGGKPITHEEVAQYLGIPRRTYTRWLKVLKDFGYIQTVRTPGGISVRVCKAKKGYAKNGSSVDKSKSDAPKSVRDAPKMAHRCATNGSSNIRQYSDLTITKQEDLNVRELKTVDNSVRGPGYYQAMARAKWLKEKCTEPFELWFTKQETGSKAIN